jgi:hypothetical protein
MLSCVWKAGGRSVLSGSGIRQLPLLRSTLHCRMRSDLSRIQLREVVLVRSAFSDLGFQGLTVIIKEKLWPLLLAADADTVITPVWGCELTLVVGLPPHPNNMETIKAVRNA